MRRGGDGNESENKDKNDYRLVTLTYTAPRLSAHSDQSQGTCFTAGLTLVHHNAYTLFTIGVCIALHRGGSSIKVDQQ